MRIHQTIGPSRCEGGQFSSFMRRRQSSWHLRIQKRRSSALQWLAPSMCWPPVRNPVTQSSVSSSLGEETPCQEQDPCEQSAVGNFTQNRICLSIVHTLPSQSIQSCCSTICYGACSSLAAMHSLTSETPPLHGSRYTEKDWNNDSTIENGQFYPLSKVEMLFAVKRNYRSIGGALCFQTSLLPMCKASAAHKVPRAVTRAGFL